METKKVNSIIIATHGEYYYKSENIKGKKAFTQIVKVPNMEFFRQTSVRSMGTDDEGKIKYKETSFLNVRGILKKRLLPLMLPNKYSDFVRVRSVTIDEIVDSTGAVIDLPLALRSRGQLIELCKDKTIPIQAENYIDIDELRTDIKEYLESPADFLLTLEKRTKARKEEKSFLELNDLDNIDIAKVDGVTTGEAAEKPKPKPKRVRPSRAKVKTPDSTPDPLA
jgi:hypothetical protein